MNLAFCENCEKPKPEEEINDIGICKKCVQQQDALEEYVEGIDYDCDE